MSATWCVLAPLRHCVFFIFTPICLQVLKHPKFHMNMNTLVTQRHDPTPYTRFGHCGSRQTGGLPIDDFKMYVKDTGSSAGEMTDKWMLELLFGLQPSADDVQPEDYFAFDVDDKVDLTSTPFDFNVVDPAGDTIMRCTNEDHTFTCTYTDYVADKCEEVTGQIFIETWLDNSNAVFGENSIQAADLSATFDVLKMTVSNTPQKVGQRDGGIIWWTIVFPLRPGPVSSSRICLTLPLSPLSTKTPSPTT